MFGLGRWKELLDVLAPYGTSEEGGWCPVPPERRDWLSRTQQQEDAMAAQTAAALQAASGFSAQRRAPGERDPAGKREGAG